MRRKISSHFGNLAGAFADGAILFPLLAALVLHTGMDGAILLASAGAAYIFAGMFFKVPMSVQPLKSVVVGALALGASSADIRIAGVGIGLFCLAVALLPVARLEKYIPRHLIHGVQFSLGLLLILKGVQWAWGDGAVSSFLAVAVFVPAAIFVQSRMTMPVLGIIAVGGVVLGLWSGDHHALVTAVPKTDINIGIILALLLPQLALTLTNSVVGTYDTARHYFGAAASRVTLKNLLLSIGFGNLIMSLVGGLNFCHGSGGLTAHVKAGAKDYTMNLYIGVLLALLAALSFIFKLDFIPHYPVLLMAALVSITGWYHIRLADRSWVDLDLRLIIIVMGVMVLLTQNMLYGLLIGILLEVLRRYNWLGMKQWYHTRKQSK
jgi:MFS superfamily sulfate permease-like transporter